MISRFDQYVSHVFILLAEAVRTCFAFVYSYIFDLSTFYKAKMSSLNVCFD